MFEFKLERILGRQDMPVVRIEKAHFRADVSTKGFIIDDFRNSVFE